ncbi:hypothetical protein ACS0TY_030798 [Phlomoides rotata]
MMKVYRIVPKIEHYGCMVDLLGRAGLVQQSYDYICKMPIQHNAVIWRTLLGSCSIHGNLAIAEIARNELKKLDPKHCGDYVFLSNLYASQCLYILMNMDGSVRYTENIEAYHINVIVL